MSTPRAFLVLGPETSGTRLLTRILIKADCVGSDGHVQAFDSGLPAGLPLIVWRRSVPHGGQWVDIAGLIDLMRSADYDVTALVVSRDWGALIKAQVASNHAASAGAALERLPTIYAHIFAALAGADVPFELVSYESLVLHPQAVQRGLLQRLGLRDNASVPIYDGNRKHYEGD